MYFKGYAALVGLLSSHALLVLQAIDVLDATKVRPHNDIRRQQRFRQRRPEVENGIASYSEDVEEDDDEQEEGGWRGEARNAPEDDDAEDESRDVRRHLRTVLRRPAVWNGGDGRSEEDADLLLPVRKRYYVPSGDCDTSSRVPIRKLLRTSRVIRRRSAEERHAFSKNRHGPASAESEVANLESLPEMNAERSQEEKLNDDSLKALSNLELEHDRRTPAHHQTSMDLEDDSDVTTDRKYAAASRRPGVNYDLLRKS